MTTLELAASLNLYAFCWIMYWWVSYARANGHPLSAVKLIPVFLFTALALADGALAYGIHSGDYVPSPGNNLFLLLWVFVVFPFLHFSDKIFALFGKVDSMTQKPEPPREKPEPPKPTGPSTEEKIRDLIRKNRQ